MYKNNGFGGRRGNGGRAWKPNDISWPPVLPRQDNTFTLTNKIDRLIMGGALYMGMCGTLLLILPTILFALKN